MEPTQASLSQKTCELTHAVIVEATTKRIVLEINKWCHLNIQVEGYEHDHKVGEVVPILAYLRIKHGQIIQPPV